MTINLTGKQVVLDETLRQYVDKKIKKLEQHGAKIHDVHVLLAIEKYRALAEVSMNVDGHPMVAKKETKELYQSIDAAIEKIQRQLDRHRSKRVGSKVRQAAARTAVRYDVSGGDSSAFGVTTRSVPVPTMSTEDALAAMASLEDNCMVFSDDDAGRLRILHRRRDGEVEIIDPLT